MFTHISQKDYLDQGLHQVIAIERALLAEDLEPARELRADPSGEKFQARGGTRQLKRVYRNT